MAKKKKKKTSKKKKTTKKSAGKTAKKTKKSAKKKTTKKTKKKSSAKKSASKSKNKSSGSVAGTSDALKMNPAYQKNKDFKPLTETPLTKEELAYFQKLLLEKRADIMGDVNSMESEALRSSRMDATGDLSSMPIHMADIGTDNFEQEFALGLVDSERRMLAEINHALMRIQEGTYGICLGTGKAIPKARLEANPWAKYCVEYAELLEKGTVTEGQKLYEESDLEDLDDDQDEDLNEDKHDDDDDEDFDHDFDEDLDDLDDEEDDTDYYSGFDDED